MNAIPTDDHDTKIDRISYGLPQFMAGMSPTEGQRKVSHLISYHKVLPDSLHSFRESLQAFAFDARPSVISSKPAAWTA